MNEGRRESRAYRTAIYLILFAGALPILLPFYWMLLSSLKTKERVEAYPPDWTPVVPRSFLTIAGQELQVTVFDDGQTSGTGVCRVKLVRDQDVLPTAPAGQIQHETIHEYYARIDGLRRRVQPRQPQSAPSAGETEVALLGTLRTETVPLASLEEHPEPRTFWSVLGIELRVQTESQQLPRAGDVTIRWTDETAPIQVAPHLFSGAATGQVSWAGRTLPAELLARETPGGFAVIRLVCPPDALAVPTGELRQEHKTRRFATIDDRRREVKLIRVDHEQGTALVEVLDEPETVIVSTVQLEQETRHEYSTAILGERRQIEPLVTPLPTDPQRPVPFRVPGALSVAPARMRSQAPLEPQWANYKLAWQEQTFDLYVVNTLFIAALVVVGTVLSCGLVGYAFARLEFRGRDGLFLLLLSTMMIPGQVTSIPTFVLFVKLGWLDTYYPLIVPHLLAQSAFFVFLFRQFMLTIPVDLEDSARIDGCGYLETWWLIMMPLAKPIVITVAVFAFIGVWNDFLYPLLYINSDEKQTVALGLQSFKSAFQYDDPQLLMAASVMMVIPSVILFFLAQKAFIRGVVVSGVKG
ncbi:MAG: ABC transporter permease subunit [Planctomycetes bacterium]|nr:ABC transporter permease subunit [Planctomycetota bacterium]